MKFNVATQGPKVALCNKIARIIEYNQLASQLSTVGQEKCYNIQMFIYICDICQIHWDQAFAYLNDVKIMQ